MNEPPCLGGGHSPKPKEIGVVEHLKRDTPMEVRAGAPERQGVFFFAGQQVAVQCLGQHAAAIITNTSSPPPPPAALFLLFTVTRRL